MSFGKEREKYHWRGVTAAQHTQRAAAHVVHVPSQRGPLARRACHVAAGWAPQQHTRHVAVRAVPATWTTRYEVSSRSPDCQSRVGPHVYVEAFAATSSVPEGRCRLAGGSHE